MPRRSLESRLTDLEDKFLGKEELPTALIQQFGEGRDLRPEALSAPPDKEGRGWVSRWWLAVIFKRTHAARVAELERLRRDPELQL